MVLERGLLLNKRYRIVEILGQGGMAAVYRAIDENLGVEVAVKENLFSTDEYAQQFRIEALILANLRHPNLPRVTDHFVIEHQGQYLIMDYIEGEDLRQRMDRVGPLKEDEAIVIGVALCDAMAYLHSRKPRVLHRDIKPGNVRITPNGHIYLVDFGLAKVVQGKEATITGARAMTPGYSPPEQYGTARTDHRSDIYSLGATLYSALTDTLPEDGLARAMGQAELTPLSHYTPTVSRRLATAIEKSLEVRPDQRFQNAEEFKKALLESRTGNWRNQPVPLTVAPPPGYESHRAHVDDQLAAEMSEPVFEPESASLRSLPISTPITDGSPQPPPIQKRKRRLLPWVSFGILVIIIGVVGIIYMTQPALPQQVLAWILPPPTQTATVTDDPPTQTRQPEIVSSQVLLSQPSSTLTPTNIPTQVPTASPTSSPSITNTPTPTRTRSPTITATPTPTPLGGVGQIAFASDRSGVPEIYLVNIDGSDLVQLTDISEGACQPEWSPDGTRLVFISPCPKNQESYPGSSLFLIDADGGNLTPLPGAPGGDYDPSWSPYGGKIAFTSLRDGGMPQIYILSLVDNSVIELPDDTQRANYHPAWSPDGKLIAFIGGDNRIWAMSPDSTNRHSLSIGGADFKNMDPVWYPDGSALIFTRSTIDNESGITWLMAVQYQFSGALPVELGDSDYSSEVSISPDGFWIVFKSFITGTHDIYFMRFNGIDRQVLFNDAAYDFDPAWRPVENQP